MMYSSMPRNPPPEQRWKRSFMDGLKNDAGLLKWANAHIVNPLDDLARHFANEDAAERAGTIRQHLGSLANLLRDGRSFDALVWDDGAPTHAVAAARRLLDTVAIWRMEAQERVGLVVDVRGGRMRANPGPALLAADLDTVASVGPTAVAAVERLRGWADADNADARGPADAMGFLQRLADHGEAEALPATSSRSRRGRGAGPAGRA